VTEGIVWCRYCHQPHRLGTRICPVTGKHIEQGLHRMSSSEAADAKLIGTLLDRKYRILRLLGRGGMGRVYEAENISLQKLVAVKFVLGATSSDGVSRLRHEARIIASLHHPNICDLYDFGSVSDGGRPYLVLERLFGETLAARLKRTPRLAIDGAIDLFAQILSGLHVAHGNQILHRDLKPQNVFIVDRLGCAPIAKLVDFGLAKDMGGDSRTTITQPGMVCGTPQYMSPEQLAGKVLDARSDLFAVGVMLHQALTGAHPFAAKSLGEVQDKILRSPAPSVRERVPRASKALEAVIARSLAKSPADRFQSAIEMQRALVDCIGEQVDVDDDDLTTTKRELNHMRLTPSVTSLTPPPSSSAATPAG
jgi:serine/threonine protein kinase